MNYNATRLKTILSASNKNFVGLLFKNSTISARVPKTF